MNKRPRLSLALTLAATAFTGLAAGCDWKVDPYQDDDERAQRTDIPAAQPTTPGREPVTTTTGTGEQGP